MAKLIEGERIAAQAEMMVGSSGLLFDDSRQKILLTRRTDNGRWCLPGGRLDPGESVAEGCVREVWEETGLHVEVERLIGIYTTPHRVITYADGNRFHLISFSFEVKVVGGTLGLSNETTEYGYFTPAEIKTMDVMEHHVERIADALAGQAAAFVR